MEERHLFLWAGFGVLVLGALAIDLGIFQRRAHIVTTREALTWTLVWIGLALTFCAGIYIRRDPATAATFLTGYLIEYSLSVDNLFVFFAIFCYFGVPPQYESKVLTWGILGALLMRGGFVAGGTALITTFDWMFYVFGAVLIFTGLKLLLKREGVVDPEKNPVVRLFKKVFRTVDDYREAQFFCRLDGRLYATPLLLVVLVVETSDIVFAVDSIPAIFSITQDAFVIYTSNIFAILGLRSLYFLLARMMNVFRFLKYGLVLILWFVGVKMLLPQSVRIPEWASLSIISAVLAGCVALSLLFREPHKHSN